MGILGGFLNVPLRPCRKIIMKKILLGLALLSSWRGLAQDHTTYFCGQVAAQQRLFHHHAGAEAECITNQQLLEEYTRQYQDESSSERGGGQQIYVIPVVFHIIHQGGNENIADEQIFDALEILNKDFRKQNSDTALIVDAFQDIAADCGIEFHLATIDPNGDCSPGIVRISSDLTYTGDDPDLKELSYWPRNSYLNIWVCANISDGVAGFSNLPGNVSSNWAAGEDGIVIRSDYVGSIGTSSASHSRSLTHEVGHWLNLYHPWGGSNNPGIADNCDMTDYVDDTPQTIGWTSCNLTGASCGSTLDNVQNFMEYSFCSRMFTEGQRTRMRAALNSSTAQRNQLWTTTNLAETGVSNPPLCLADFNVNMSSVCVGDSVYFTDASYHNVSEWTWDFGDGTILTGTDPLEFKNPIHQYNTPGTYNVTLEVSNGTQSISTVQSTMLTILDTAMIASPFVEGFEAVWPGNNWMLSNPNGDETWEITPSAHYTGDRCLKLRNYSIDAGNADELYTATFDMTGADTIFISYKWAYANRTTTTDDKFRISASGDCGNSWVIRKLRKGTTNLPTATATNSQFTPVSLDDWDGEIMALNNVDWYNDRFRVKFDFSSLGGNNFYLDDINIYASGVSGIYQPEALFLYNVYPNPSSGNMTLELGQLNHDVITVELYNATGQLCSIVYSGAVSAGRQLINIPDQPAGLYNLVLRKDGHTAVQKLIFE
jgi:PKD repeat protein